MIRTVDDNYRRLVRNQVIAANNPSLENILGNHHVVLGEVDDDGGQPLLELSAHPRNLYDLSIKYEFLGLGGRKPARLFTAQERGP